MHHSDRRYAKVPAELLPYHELDHGERAHPQPLRIEALVKSLEPFGLNYFLKAVQHARIRGLGCIHVHYSSFHDICR